MAPYNKRSLGNDGPTDPMQARDVTFHSESVIYACVKAIQFWEMVSHHQPLMGFNFAFTKFEDLGCAILEVTHSWVLRELTNKNIWGWVYMVSPGWAVVSGTRDLGIMQALNTLVREI